MSKNEKPHDCLAAKDAAQRRILGRIAGHPPEEQIAIVRREVEESALGKWWLSLPIDPGPRAEALPTAGRAGKRR
jgi:hypothetical protein